MVETDFRDNTGNFIFQRQKNMVDNWGRLWYNQFCWLVQGEMAEWFKALVLKTSDVARHRGFESLSLRQILIWRSTQEAEGAPLLRE